ncbi:hypothetical protein F2Q70_00029834 [Brassica cretica]|uniref:Uncharacterized protein n=1 Tax=Brassica cretica TaxID=69181 RepID=A0A8S9FCM0_BRACR|nr:hypothetical protein F2Q70_00029834 [Brassica cretica]KAF2552803.1 hypothetical protein F2Q68_00034299 [Brassica cretica]
MDRSQRPTWPGSGLVSTLRSGTCVDRSQRCDLVRAWTDRNVNVAIWSVCGPVATFRPGPCSVRSLCVDRFGYLSDVLGQLVFGGSIEAFLRISS